MSTDENTRTYFTNGSCRLGKPGPGGWAVIGGRDANEEIATGGEHKTTKNRMELLAVTAALEHSQSDVRAVIHTDSSYARDGVNKWRDSWHGNGWRNSRGRLVLHRDLWERIHASINARKGEVQVRGEGQGSDCAGMSHASHVAVREANAMKDSVGKTDKTPKPSPLDPLTNPPATASPNPTPRAGAQGQRTTTVSVATLRTVLDNFHDTARVQLPQDMMIAGAKLTLSDEDTEVAEYVHGAAPKSTMTGRALIARLMEEIVDMDAPGITVHIDAHGQGQYTHAVQADDVPVVDWAVDQHRGAEPK